MYALNELALGYVLAVLGVVLLFAPSMVGLLNSYAPDASVTMGANLAHESVEFRRQRRLPLRKKFSMLPNRGLVGGTMVLLLLPLAFVMVFQNDLAKGIYVRLSPLHHSGPDEICLEGPIVVTVKQRNSLSQTLVNGTEVRQEDLQQVLKSKLSGRANWEVFVEADDSLPFADGMDAIDAINALHAKAVILTPKLKRQMANSCSPR
jgi:biopolymer transport protein ExbD